MTKANIITISCLVAGFLGLFVFTSAPVQAASVDPFDEIESAYRNDEISFDEKARLFILAIKSPSELPVKYFPLQTTAGKFTSRGATTAILDIYQNWELLSPQTQQMFAGAFYRPERQHTHISGSGFFKLHYDTSGDDAVPTADTNSNQIPDFIERCAAYCDTSLDVHISLGYLTPPSDGTEGGDSLFDVYFEDMSSYGYAMPEGDGPEPWNDVYSYLVMNNNFLGFPSNDDPEGIVAGAAKVTAAHEFHHCVQFAYDPNEYLWFMELDAVYIEDVIYDHVNDNYNYLMLYLSFPQISLMTTGYHSYSSFIWGLYLAQRFDTSLMRAVWEGARYADDVFTSLSDSLFGRYGWSQDSAFAEFCTWNYCTGVRDDGLHHEEASDYPLVAIGASHHVYPVNNMLSPADPGGYACCYVQFQPGGSSGTVSISFDGSDDCEWLAYLIKSTAINTHEFEVITLSTGFFEGNTEIEDFETYESLTLVGINVSEFSDSYSFRYWAEMIGPWDVTSQVLTTDSQVYSGAVRNWEYQITNPAEVNDVYNIIFWDDSGWISIDTFDVFVPAGSSHVQDMPIQPPPGTPLGQSSDLYFKVVSKNDTTVFDTDSSRAFTIMQYGDLEFDGMVDIGDVTWLINYLFLEGPDPLPVKESGNFDCEGIIDVGDLTELISYLFIFGPDSPCNPY